MPETEANTITVIDDEPRPEFLERQFVVPGQQYAAGSLGMFLLIANELMLFSVLFVAYIVFRTDHPEIFRYAHLYEDRYLGAVNTAILLTSSFTMSLAIRAIRFNRQRALKILLSITLFLGLAFVGVKAYEWHDHWQKGLVWGKLYLPEKPPSHAVFKSRGQVSVPAQVGPMAGDNSGSGMGTEAGVGASPIYGTNWNAGAQGGEGVQAGGGEEAALNLANTQKPAPDRQSAFKPKHPLTPTGYRNAHSRWPKAAIGPYGITTRRRRFAGRWRGPAPSDVRLFFTLYFCLTGLHLLHLFVGMGAVCWILWRARKKQFNYRYFYPVQYVGLYWHFVDIVWMFIFTVVYLLR